MMVPNVSLMPNGLSEVTFRSFIFAAKVARTLSSLALVVGTGRQREEPSSSFMAKIEDVVDKSAKRANATDLFIKFNLLFK